MSAREQKVVGGRISREKTAGTSEEPGKIWGRNGRLLDLVCRSGARAGQEQGARRCRQGAASAFRDSGSWVVLQGSRGWGLYECCTAHARTARLPRQAQQHHLNHLSLSGHTAKAWMAVYQKILDLSTSLPKVFTSRCPGACPPRLWPSHLLQGGTGVGNSLRRALATVKVPRYCTASKLIGDHAVWRFVAKKSKP